MIADARATPARRGPRPADLLAVGLPLVVVTLLHYVTAIQYHPLHGIYRRLYYFPIVLGAFRWGWRGGLGTALLACAVYAPHAIGWIGFDPAPGLEKGLEMVLYVAIGALTGVLVEHRDRALRAEAAAAVGLRRALDEKAAMEAEMLREARLAAVGRLSAGLAHEIRNPLASIQGAAEILADDVPPENPRARLLEILKDESKRLNGVLTRFLDFARPREAGTEPVDLAVLADDVAELLRHEPGTAAIAVERGGTDRGRVVFGDRERLRQLVWNLVLNASQAAGTSGRVVVKVAGEDGRVAIEVRDDGPGFTPEALAHLGTPFVTTKAGGSGLGLAVCQRVAEDHGGRLRARNAPGGGAVVAVTLPAGKEADDGEDPAGR